MPPNWKKIVEKINFSSILILEERSGAVVSMLNYCTGYPGLIPAGAEFPAGI